MTRTYATLDVSPECYQEIRERLETAAYDHAFHEDGVIDMHGIALRPEGGIGKVSPARRWPDPPPAWPPPPEPWPDPPMGKEGGER